MSSASSIMRPPRSGNKGGTGHQSRMIPIPVVVLLCLASSLVGSMVTNAIQVESCNEKCVSQTPPNEIRALVNASQKHQQQATTQHEIHSPKDCLKVLKQDYPNKDWTSFEEYIHVSQQQQQQQEEITTYKREGNGIRVRRGTISQNNNNKQNGGGGGLFSSFTGKSSQKRLPQTMKRFVEGMGRVKKRDFIEKFDTGGPMDLRKHGNDEILMLYNRRDAMPSDRALAQQVEMGPNDIPLLSPEEATENCQYLHILNQAADNKQRCFAYIPGYESMIVQNWMRFDDDPKKHWAPLDTTAPLHLASRAKLDKGKEEFEPPARKRFIELGREFVVQYLSRLKEAHDYLRPLANAAATDENSVVVMVCNHGQSELLMNFVCAAKSRGLSTNPIILFATDKETDDLAKSLGLKSYYDEETFEKLPSKAAQSYGDLTFALMMMAKIYSVHSLVSMGYNVLFQDVDMIWYKNPLTFFEDTSLPTYDFDMHFQDDGSRQVRFAPYSANSGFYYIRNNLRTQNFMESFVMSSHLVLTTRSHQQTMIQLLNEHSSLYALKVKVYSNRDTDYFPGGYHYHMQKAWMKDFLKGEKEDPLIFHMCWTENKDNKLLFLRQMGEWYVQDKCVGSTAKEITAATSETQIVSICCSAEPLISCHYRDKPSKFPCTDSPPIDKGGRSFW